MNGIGRPLSPGSGPGVRVPCHWSTKRVLKRAEGLGRSQLLILAKFSSAKWGITTTTKRRGGKEIKIELSGGKAIFKRVKSATEIEAGVRPYTAPLCSNNSEAISKRPSLIVLAEEIWRRRVKQAPPPVSASPFINPPLQIISLFYTNPITPLFLFPTERGTTLSHLLRPTLCRFKPLSSFHPGGREKNDTGQIVGSRPESNQVTLGFYTSLRVGSTSIHPNWVLKGMHFKNAPIDQHRYHSGNEELIIFLGTELKDSVWSFPAATTGMLDGIPTPCSSKMSLPNP